MSYKILGEYIQQVNVRNKDLADYPLLGVSVQKVFIPSIANTVGTDFSKYKILEKGQFTYIADTSRRGDKIGVALLTSYENALVSQAYTTFRISDVTKLLPEYLMMWFSRPEFDRYARYHSIGSVREVFDWDAMCNVELPVPSIEKQREIVAQYQAVENKIKVNEQICEKLEATAQALYKHTINLSEVKIAYRLGDLIEIKGGFSYNSESLGKGNTYLLGMGCVSFTERFVESGMRLYSDDIPSTHIVKSKDIIIATRQQSENMPILGFPAMIPSSLKEKRLVIASNLYRVVNKSNLSNELIYQILKSDDYQNRIKEQTKGTTVGMITKDAIEDFIFEAPGIEILINQQEKINTIVSQIFCKKEETQKLTQLQSLLLSRLAVREEVKIIS